MSIIKIDPAKAQAKANAERIAELKKLLVDSDYKVLPDYDKDAESIKAERQAWREEIRTLEALSA
jgi:NAD(P)H-dependent FMN reductase